MVSNVTPTAESQVSNKHRNPFSRLFYGRRNTDTTTCPKWTIKDLKELIAYHCYQISETDTDHFAAELIPAHTFLQDKIRPLLNEDCQTRYEEGEMVVQAGNGNYIRLARSENPRGFLVLQLYTPEQDYSGQDYNCYSCTTLNIYPDSVDKYANQYSLL